MAVRTESATVCGSLNTLLFTMIILFTLIVELYRVGRCELAIGVFGKLVLSFVHTIMRRKRRSFVLAGFGVNAALLERLHILEGGAYERWGGSCCIKSFSGSKCVMAATRHQSINQSKALI